MPPTEIAWFVLADRQNPNGRGKYARLSLNPNGLSTSVANQLSDARGYFESYGWLNDKSLEFSDDNISASEYTTKERPDFERLLNAIRERRLWYLLITEVARITRNLAIGLEVVQIAKDAGGLLIETTEGKRFDLMTTTGVHDFMQAVLEASRESGTKSDRIKRNKRNSAHQGRYLGGRPRYGRIKAIKDEYGRVINKYESGVKLDETAPYWAQAIKRVADGDHLLTIVRDLATLGITAHTGKPLTAPVFRKAISSPQMYGAASYKGRVVKEDAFPPIVDKTTWEKAMAYLNAEDRMKGNERKGWGTYLLTGKTECGGCGNAMTAHARDDGKGSERAYLCRTYDNAGNRVGCGKRRLAEPVEMMVADYVKAKFNSDAFREALRTAMQEDSGNDGLGIILDRIRELEGKLNELEDAYTNGGNGFDLKQLSRMQAGIQNQLKETKAKADRMFARKGVSAAFSGNFNEVWDLASRDQRRQFMDLIGLHVVIHPRNPKAPRAKWTHEGTDKTWVFNPRLIEITSDF